MEKEHHDILVQASHDFMKYRKKFTHVCTASAVVYKTGAVYHVSHACFAGAGYGRGIDSIALLVSLSDTFGREGLEVGFTPEENVRYLDWLMNRSPWQSAFLGKDAAKSYENRFVVLRTDIPANMLFGGGVGVRKMWETTSVKRVWLDMTAVGVQEDFAYYLGCCAQLSGGNIGWNGYEPGHGNLETPFSYSTLLNFLSHKATKLTNLYTSGESVRGYSAMWNGRDDKAVNDFMKDKLFIEEGKEQVQLNPFAKAAQTQLKLVPYKKAVEAMPAFQHLLFKEIGFEYEPKDIVYPEPLARKPIEVKVKAAFKRDRYGRFRA